jgi:hypothetical protein
VRFFLCAVLAVALLALAPTMACSTGSETPNAGDASIDGSADAGPDAALVCGDAGAATKPRCQRGDACNCDDVGSVAPICVGGAWACAPGSTRYEDCYGVPPVRPCVLDDAGHGHDPDGG